MARVAKRYKKKSKVEKFDYRSVYFAGLAKKKVNRISRVYVGDQMVLRSKQKMLTKFKLRGCFVVVDKNLSAEALQWLERDGQSVRLPALPQFPNDAIGEDQPNQPNQPNPNPLQQNEQIEPTALERAEVAEVAKEEPKQNEQNLLQQNEANEPTEGTEALELAEKDPNQNPLHEFEPFEPLLWTEDCPATPAMPSNSSNASNASQISGKRRFSMAGGLFFSVNQNVCEIGSDFLTKVAKESKIISQPAKPAEPEVQNEFDPILRLDNPPFALRGRQRAASHDGYFRRFVSRLETIIE